MRPPEMAAPGSERSASRTNFARRDTGRNFAFMTTVSKTRNAAGAVLREDDAMDASFLLAILQRQNQEDLQIVAPLARVCYV
jgi:hypothetical protein